MWVFRHLGDESKRLAREESGAALLLTLAVFLLLFVICCGVFAIGETIRQKVELQNACDAAAYSAAVAQADVLSRMAVVNRAMAWTYIQLCRAQMDYIVFRWLKLSCKRYQWDLENKARTGNIIEGRHYNFEDISAAIEKVLKWAHIWPFYRCGLNCRYDKHGQEGYGWYIGVGDTPEERKERRIKLNERDDLCPKAEEEIRGPVIDGRDNGGIEGGRGGAGGTFWQQEQEERIRFLKGTLQQLNAALMALQMEMLPSITSSAETVLKAHLPKKPDGTEDGEAAKDFYFLLGGGVCEAGPKEYFDTTNKPGYFKGLYNTEEDELQFLSMAGGVPSRRVDAPAWMKERPVLLSDWFGAGDNPTETADGIRRFTAGGLDQWYVRTSAAESENSSEVNVPRFPFALDSMKTPGGIRRAYKNTNREDTRVWRLCWHNRPNHVFCGDVSAITRMNFGEYKQFFDLEGILNKLLPGDYAATVLKWGGAVFTGGGTVYATEALEMILKEAVGAIVEEAISSVVSALSDQLLDIPPSDGHTRTQTPDQCSNVNESISLVAEYEWASAYWMCPWVEYKTFHHFHWKWKKKEYGHYRLPVAEFIGCGEHGYGEFPAWIVRQLAVLAGGSTRDGYNSCFINFDGTRDKRYNTHLRGYARVYGDDAEIFNELGYIGEPACPWLLDESFFHGDGTIFVGLARKQRNPFLRAFGSLLGTVEKPSFYSPFGLEGRNGGERYLVALSAARAAFSPRPAGGDGTGSVNDETKGAPGMYDVAYDGVLDKKLHLRPWKSIPGTRFGCACGNEENTERLARGWNLSQTDWDATLLPVRFAMARHSAFDSLRPQPVSWCLDEDGIGGTAKLLDILDKMRWNRLVGEPDRRSSDEILSFPTDGSASGEGLYDLLYRRKLL